MTGPKRMELLTWQRVDKGVVVGRASVRLPIGLEIADITVFQKDGRTWAGMPAEPVRDRDGQIMKDDRGKARYRTNIKWETRELADRFGEALVALIEAEHGL
jgi:hypothetical protein